MMDRTVSAAAPVFTTTRKVAGMTPSILNVPPPGATSATALPGPPALAGNRTTVTRVGGGPVILKTTLPRSDIAGCNRIARPVRSSPDTLMSATPHHVGGTVLNISRPLDGSLTAADPAGAPRAVRT